MSTLEMINLFGKHKTKVLFVASEAAPFVKAGGLGEVMYSLPRALGKIGYEARVMIPRYAGIDTKKFHLVDEIKGLDVPTDTTSQEQPSTLVCNVKRYDSGDSDDAPVTTYFLENMEYYEQRANVYGYADDAVRWVLFCRGVLEFLRRAVWVPDIIVCADWQTGFLPNYLKTTYKDDAALNSIATVFSIHNIFFQGMFDHRYVTETDYDAGRASIGSFFDERLLKLNGMRRGILHADVITTVSPHYAKEIMSNEYGEGQQELLRERRGRVFGVLNSIDYRVFDPETNPNLVYHYSARDPEGKAENKTELQNRFGLKKDPRAFLIGIVSRLSEQKGFDLLFSIADTLLSELNIQFCIVGSGDGRYMDFFQELEKKHSGKVAAHLIFNKDLPHLVYAGADAILIPSKFEPSGLSQMEAMRYGCIPVVRRTGGLADTVKEYDPAKKEGNGFGFDAFDSMALVIALTRAYETFQNPETWLRLQKRAMRTDFSWTASAQEYRRIFTVAYGLAHKKPEA